MQLFDPMGNRWTSSTKPPTLASLPPSSLSQSSSSLNEWSMCQWSEWHPWICSLLIKKLPIPLNDIIASYSYSPRLIIIGRREVNAESLPFAYWRYIFDIHKPTIKQATKDNGNDKGKLSSNRYDEECIINGWNMFPTPPMGIHQSVIGLTSPNTIVVAGMCC
jgi:hypothetical protein